MAGLPQLRYQCTHRSYVDLGDGNPRTQFALAHQGSEQVLDGTSPLVFEVPGESFALRPGHVYTLTLADEGIAPDLATPLPVRRPGDLLN